MGVTLTNTEYRKFPWQVTGTSILTRSHTILNQN
jgi:hypothetical protein